MVAMLLAAGLAGCAGTAPYQEAAAGRIDGAVLDQGLSPHAGATVHLAELGLEDTTNDLGGFTFRQLPPGLYTLHVEVDGEEDKEIVPVGKDIERVILQVERERPDAPRTTTLRHAGETASGLPGEVCRSCSWTTRLHDQPDHVRITATWDEGDLRMAGSPSLLVVELRDAAGRMITWMEGPSPLTSTVRASALAADSDELQVRVRVHGDNDAPAPGAEVLTKLELFYGKDPGY